MTVGAVLLDLAGFALLSLAMRRHFADLFGRPPRRHESRVLAAAGWLLLAMSLAVALHADLSGIGLLGWFEALSATGMAWVLMLALVTRHRRD